MSQLASSVEARTPDVVPGVDDPLFTLLFEQSPLYVGVVEWLGDDARYLAVNPATAARLGRSVDAIRGRRARELGLPTDACAAWAHLFAQAADRSAPVRAEWEATTAEGRKSFRTTVVPLPTPAHAAPRFAYLTEELTRVRALEERLGGSSTSAASLSEDVEQPLAHALHVLDVAGDEVETLAAIHPELELGDAAGALRAGIRTTRRAHQHLREMLLG
jgi:PAS domain-containing protein